MQGHANKACAGKVAETFAEATPEAIGQARGLMEGFQYPPTSNHVVAIGTEGGDHVFDVTYTGDSGARLSMREWVRKSDDGGWKIVRVENPG